MTGPNHAKDDVEQATSECDAGEDQLPPERNGDPNAVREPAHERLEPDGDDADPTGPGESPWHEV
jgi:hypothetical protein